MTMAEHLKNEVLGSVEPLTNLVMASRFGGAPTGNAVGYLWLYRPITASDLLSGGASESGSSAPRSAFPNAIGD